ncbi:SusD family protein [bacterium A37T11]|nr:SusD family protein [bacterium A37T11]
MSRYKNLLTTLKLNIFLLFISTFYLTSCKSFVAIDPPKNALINKVVFSSEASLSSAISGMYARLYSYSYNAKTTLFSTLQADDLHFSITGSYAPFENNAVTEDISNINTLWGNSYQLIYIANALLEGINQNAQLSESTIRQTRGEALFIRALAYFHLLNNWGDMPLVTTTDYEVNRYLGRTSSKEIYQKLISDLEEAYTLLSENYPSTGHLRPNRYAVASLLSEIYLFNENWTKSAEYADKVINSNLYQLEDSLNNVFISTSKEAIWQLKATGTEINTKLGQLLLNSQPLKTLASYVQDDLYTAFEAGDQRKTHWITGFTYLGTSYHVPYKYKLGYYAGTTPEEYEVMSRLPELYLYRAEANAHLSKLDEAIDDLNIIRHRAGLSSLPKGTLSQEATLDAVMKESRFELMFEGSHRWYDLKRTGKALEVLSAVKPGFTKSDLLWPIPLEQQQNNSLLTPNN